MSTYLDDAWFEGAFNALNDTLRVDARMKHEMIQFLLDEGLWDAEKLQWTAAEARFNSCLNRNKVDSFFKLSEIWALMKRFNRFGIFLAMADDLGFEVRLKPTAERVHELLASMLETNERLEQEYARQRVQLERITSTPIPTNVVPRHPGTHKPLFSRADQAC
jgi:hypothetical protein